MASLWKDQRSPCWIACVTVFSGTEKRQLKKSTGTADRGAAWRIADLLEEIGRGTLAPDGIKEVLEKMKDQRAARAARKAADSILRMTRGKGMECETVRGWGEAWLKKTRNEVSRSTWSKYELALRLFCDSLGGKADQDITLVRQEDVARFRDVQAARVAPATVNLMLKIVRILFRAAEADGVITRNETKHVRPVKNQADRVRRRAFTLDELNRLLGCCDPEWKSLVLCGFYTGARLGDLSLLTWQHVDLAQNDVVFNTGKTGRTVVVPLAKPLREYLLGMPASDDIKAPVHPRAHAIVRREGRTSTVSRQFGELMIAAGLAKARTHHAGAVKKGRDSRREVSELSFHALRHSAVSFLKAAGVSDSIARDLVGHESAAVNRLYTHIPNETKLEAVNRLPDLNAVVEPRREEEIPSSLG